MQKLNPAALKPVTDAELREAVVLAINEQATDEARQDPGVLPVLQQIHRKIAQLTAPELLAWINPEVRDAE
jgi:hypothetical protein